MTPNRRSCTRIRNETTRSSLQHATNGRRCGELLCARLHRGSRAQVTRNAYEDRDMLYYAVVFLVIAIIAGFFGFTGIAGTSAWIAHVLFVLFLVLFIVSLIFRGRPSV